MNDYNAKEKFEKVINQLENLATDTIEEIINLLKESESDE